MIAAVVLVLAALFGASPPPPDADFENIVRFCHLDETMLQDDGNSLVFEALPTGVRAQAIDCAVNDLMPDWAAATYRAVDPSWGLVAVEANGLTMLLTGEGGVNGLLAIYVTSAFG